MNELDRIQIEPYLCLGMFLGAFLIIMLAEALFLCRSSQHFGFNLSAWDYLFNSYTDQSDDGHLDMQIGLPNFRANQESGFLRMLSHPFRLTKSQ